MFESMPMQKQNKKEDIKRITLEEQELINGINKTLEENKEKVIELAHKPEVEEEKIINLKPEQIVPPSIEERVAKNIEKFKKGEITPLPKKPEEERAKKIPEEIKAMFTKNGVVDIKNMTKYLNEHLYGIGAKPKENPGAERRL
jgi:RNA recognition motif-containing protein